MSAADAKRERNSRPDEAISTKSEENGENFGSDFHMTDRLRREKDEESERGTGARRRAEM